MIHFHDLTKIYVADGVEKVVADQINLSFPPDRAIALLGRNGAGKSTLLRLIAGTLLPTSGSVEVQGSVSWPVGFSGAFHPELTGLQNTRFVSRIYGVDSDELVAFVEEFSELGPHFNLPVRTYSTGMRARLAFAVSMGIDFDTYLIDEITSVGDISFRERCEVVLKARVRGKGAVVVAHNVEILRRTCDSGVVMEHGRAHWFDDLEDAIAFHRETMQVA